MIISVAVALIAPPAANTNEDHEDGQNDNPDDSQNNSQNDVDTVVLKLVTNIDYDQAVSNGTLNPGDEAAHPATEGTHYIIILIEMKNNGDQWVNLTANSWTGTLDNGSFIKPTANYGQSGSGAAAVHVAPGATSYPMVAFEVPNGTHLVRVGFAGISEGGSIAL